MDDVEYSKLNYKKRRGKPQQNGPQLEEPSTIIYADIKTSHIQLPVEDTKPNDTENTRRCSKWGKVTKILTVLIIIAFSCALAFLIFKKFSEEPVCSPNGTATNSDHHCDAEVRLMEIKTFCVNISGGPAGCTVCPDGWVRHRESCYYFSSLREVGTWNESREMCDGMGAHLLVIEDNEEKEFINRSSRRLANELLWIGMYRDGDGWRWVDGQRYDTGISQLVGESSGTCACMHARTGDYNIKCQHKLSWMCEKRALKI